MSEGSHPHLRAAELFSVKGLTAAITGAGTGIGLMLTLALVENGCKVYAIGRGKDKLDEIISRYSGDGKERGQIIAVPGDVTNKESLIEVVKAIEGYESNGIHMLINNAGIAGEDSREGYSDVDKSDPKALSSQMFKSSYDDWQSIIQTNTTAAYFTAVAFLPLLAKGKSLTKGYSSQVINVSSISGVMKKSSGGQFAYAASKAATFQMTKQLATEFLETGVRVNQIAPGVFPSQMTAGGHGEDQKSELPKDGAGSSTPAGRAGDEKDMAGAILFLASRAGVFVNGQAIIPDGGATLQGSASL